jgi:hypothetical protein
LYIKRLPHFFPLRFFLPVVYPQDLTKYINSLLFFCAAKPGLSRVLLELLNFDATAIRCRPVAQLAGGPRNEVGWLVGQPLGEALLNHQWENGILIGKASRARCRKLFYRSVFVTCLTDLHRLFSTRSQSFLRLLLLLLLFGGRLYPLRRREWRRPERPVDASAWQCWYRGRSKARRLAWRLRHLRFHHLHA